MAGHPAANTQSSPTKVKINHMRLAARLPRLLTLSLAVSSLFPTIVTAQQIPDAGAVQRETRNLEPTMPGAKGLPVVRSADEAKRAGTDTTEFAVSGFKIIGNTAVPTATLMALLPAAGRRYTLGELQDTAAAITVFYRANGFFLARAYVPAQELVGGVVTIAVAEGALSQVVNRSALAFPASAILQSVPTGAAIRQTSIERALLLLTDMPGSQVAGTLSPGASAGSSDLAVDVTFPRKLRGLVSADNYGGYFIGPARLTIGADVYNLSGVGDALSARITGSERGGLLSGNLRYERVVAASGLKASVEAARAEYTLGGDFRALDARGSATSIDAGLDYPLRRALASSMTIGAHVLHKALVDKIGNAGPNTDKSANLMMLNASGDSRGLDVAVAWNVALSGGRLSIDSESARVADAAALGTAGNFAKLYGGARINLRGPERTAFTFAGQIQYASGNLDSSEKMALGGPAGVRAYPVGEASSDRAVLVSAEIRRPLAFAAVNASLFGFVDAARGQQNADPLAGSRDNMRHLAGLGAGLDISYRDSLVIRLMLARAVGNEKSTAAPDKASRGWLLVSSAF
jgi:hemolysin activation/secretion protein